MRALLAVLAAFVVGSLIGLASTPAKAQGATWTSMSSDKYTADTPSYPFQQSALPATPRTPFNHHTSTLAEGVLRGRAAVIEAVGVREVLYAQARNLNEEARTRHLKNKVILTETFLARRNALKEDFRNRTLRAWEWQQQADEHRAEREQSVLLQAYRVPSTQLNRVTGAIVWPAGLRHPALAEHRDVIQASYERMAEYGSEYIGRNGVTIADATDEMRELLRNNREQLDVPWCEYFESQSFLVGLKYEAQYWNTDDKTDDSIAKVASR